ncbi:hypothetical protein PoB_006911600 [Plakobranchus ocellatus]|uniref:Uncharacterized protein n=1 Tax=Plakobranchus ocellatus TaxID=259542 RepID=A0AAV4DEN4_9GAST|nr:hypothetical protein PoB_006911600 [Plakobranchus ocellatus]
MSVFTIIVLYLCLPVRMSGSLLSHNDIHDVLVPTTAATTSAKVPRNARNSSNLEQLQTHPASVSSKLPLHNFWPWIPVAGMEADSDTSAQLFTFSKKLPSHNFWPWIPVVGTEVGSATSAQLFTFGKKLPSHNFWPWVPLRDFGLSGFWGNWTHLFRVPKHSFWPFVPITADDRNKKFPSTGPKLPRLPWPPSLHREFLHH